MKYTERSVTEWIENGYNPIHIIGDYYLLRKHSIIHKNFSTYRLAKIHDTIPPIKRCLCGGEAKLSKCGDQKEFYVVRCPNCLAMAGSDYGVSINPAEAVRRWNRCIHEEKAVE